MKEKKKVAVSLILIMLMTTLGNHLLVQAAGTKGNESKLTVYVGQSIRLKNKKISASKATWKSSNKKIATVSKKGKVKARKKGTVTISATYKNKTYKWKVKVKKPQLQKSKVTVEEGKSYQLKLLGTKIKSCKSNDKKIATVTKRGKITAKNAGSTTIYVIGKNRKTYKCKVTVREKDVREKQTEVEDSDDVTTETEAETVEKTTEVNPETDTDTKSETTTENKSETTNESKPETTTETEESNAEGSEDEVDVTDTSIEAFKKEIRKMVMTGDMSKHDISRYNLTYQKMNAAWNELVAEDLDLQVAVACYGSMFLQTEKNTKEICTTVRIYDCDTQYEAPKFQRRYTETKRKLNEMLAFVADNPEMTEMDKVLYVHEYIADTTSYEDTGYISHCAGGALGDGICVCEGYAKALQLVLVRMGIQVEYMHSKDMNHGWDYVKVDGEWYHVDLCWDDNSSTIKHCYFIRNDAQFNTAIPRKHYNWYMGSWGSEQLYESTSTKYDDWFVHDIQGKMLYKDGYWYYRSGNNVMKAKLDGTYNEVYKAITDTSSFVLEDYVE